MPLFSSDFRDAYLAAIGAEGAVPHVRGGQAMTNPLSPKERVKIPRQKMPEQEPTARRQNFQEVNLGIAAA